MRVTREQLAKLQKHGPLRDSKTGEPVTFEATKRRGVMNATEAEHARNLDARPDVARYVFEGISFRLATGARYTPDFFVCMKPGAKGYPYEIHEVKGGLIQEAAMVRLKVAAANFPEFRFVMWQKKNGVWTEKEIPS